MPLRDHFRSPLDDETSWEGFHGQWPAMIVIDLARRLPPGYVASPRVHLGAFVEIDVATYERQSADVPSGSRAHPPSTPRLAGRHARIGSGSWKRGSTR